MKYYIRFKKFTSYDEVETIIRKVINDVECLRFSVNRVLVSTSAMDVDCLAKSLAINSNGILKTIEDISNGVRIPIRSHFNSSSAAASFFQDFGGNHGHNIFSPCSPFRKRVGAPPPYVSVGL